MPSKKSKPADLPRHHLSVEYGKFRMTGHGLGVIAVVAIVSLVLLATHLIGF